MFALATGAWDGQADLMTIGALGAEVVSDAILRAVRAARSIEGYPSATELKR
jgi:L-aminopeptidase/D-esterase-like protein